MKNTTQLSLGELELVNQVVVNVLSILGKNLTEEQKGRILDKALDILQISNPNHNFLFPSVEARESEISGFGVFAKENIKKGQQLIKLGGRITHISDWLFMDEDLRRGHIMVGPQFTLGAGIFRDIDNADYVNHSCNPNVGIQGHLDVIAMRDIKKGEEITFDYGTVVGDVEVTEEQKVFLREQGYLNENEQIIVIPECGCGHESCRGVVTGEDWKRLQSEEYYKGFFPHHVQKLIDRNK